MASRGLLTGGSQWSEVALVKNREGVGDSVGIFLSQDADSDAHWRFRVRVQTGSDGGSVDMGDFECESPQEGVLPSRLVAIAYCPGAISWAVSANTPDATERADAWL